MARQLLEIIGRKIGRNLWFKRDSKFIHEKTQTFTNLRALWTFINYEDMFGFCSQLSLPAPYPLSWSNYSIFFKNNIRWPVRCERFWNSICHLTTPFFPLSTTLFPTKLSLRNLWTLIPFWKLTPCCHAFTQESRFLFCLFNNASSYTLQCIAVQT